MKRAHITIALIAALGACLIATGAPEPQAGPVVAPEPRSATMVKTLKTSAVNAILEANGGKAPATGEQLWKTLASFGGFAQLPVVFSAERLDTGLGNPRVVIAQWTGRLSDAEPNQPNLLGRLFFAANMERNANGADPRVVYVEFISWNTATRRFDFGVIDPMGSSSREPNVRILDGTRCFACHKNRGPILGQAPWTNTTHHSAVRSLIATHFRLPAILPGGILRGNRERIDGMALSLPEAPTVDIAVAAGRLLPIDRKTFQLMTKSAAGRKVLLTLLTALVEPGELDPNNPNLKLQVNAWDKDPLNSYVRFLSDWLNLLKTTNSGILRNFAPIATSTYDNLNVATSGGSPTPPAARGTPGAPQRPHEHEHPEIVWGHSIPVGGFGPAPAGNLNDINKDQAETRKNLINDRLANDSKEKVAPPNPNATPLEFVPPPSSYLTSNMASAIPYVLNADQLRIESQSYYPSTAQPSNPRAFVTELPAPPRQPSAIVNTGSLALAIGLTRGDRKLLAQALEETVERVLPTKVSTKTLSRAIFEGPEFADVFAGGPLPDRDDFKDRFFAGLDRILKTKYQKDAYGAERRLYAYGPPYDPQADQQVEPLIAPKTACLRCHDVGPKGKTRASEPIPVLAFDPFDVPAREEWLRTAAPELKQRFLSRLLVRLVKDADMPPHDSPEHALFRVKDAAKIGQVKAFLEGELKKK